MLTLPFILHIQNTIIQLPNLQFSRLFPKDIEISIWLELWLYSEHPMNARCLLWYFSLTMLVRSCRVFFSLFHPTPASSGSRHRPWLACPTPWWVRGVVWRCSRYTLPAHIVYSDGLECIPEKKNSPDFQQNFTCSIFVLCVWLLNHLCLINIRAVSHDKIISVRYKV